MRASKSKRTRASILLLHFPSYGFEHAKTVKIKRPVISKAICEQVSQPE